MPSVHSTVAFIHCVGGAVKLNVNACAILSMASRKMSVATRVLDMVETGRWLRKVLINALTARPQLGARSVTTFRKSSHCIT